MITAGSGCRSTPLLRHSPSREVPKRMPCWRRCSDPLPCNAFSNRAEARMERPPVLVPRRRARPDDQPAREGSCSRCRPRSPNHPTASCRRDHLRSRARCGCLSENHSYAGYFRGLEDLRRVHGITCCGDGRRRHRIGYLVEVVVVRIDRQACRPGDISGCADISENGNL